MIRLNKHVEQAKERADAFQYSNKSWEDCRETMIQQ
jgi:hypothetical protein